jgi:DNA-directed RNA polymerase specialized sigma24 family protein
MTESHDPEKFRQTPDEAETQLLWDTAGEMLLRLLKRKFGLPPDDARTLVEEAFRVYYELTARPRDATSWLIAAACTNAQRYLRRRGLAAGDAASDPQALAESLFDPAFLEALPERAREALRMRHPEGKSFAEIAEELGVTRFAGAPRDEGAEEAAQRPTCGEAARLRG